MQLDLPQKKEMKLSLTPLIDVVFLLLIFFMLASTFSRFSQLLLSAQKSEGQAEKDIKFILVRVDGEGQINVNGQEIEKTDLVGKIDELALTPSMKLVIKPMKGASVQHLVSILEQARKSKIKNPVVVR